MVRKHSGTTPSTVRCVRAFAVIVALALGTASCTSDTGPATNQSAASASPNAAADAREASGGATGTGSSDAPSEPAGAGDAANLDGPTAAPTGAETAASAADPVANPSAPSGAVLEGAPTTRAPSIGLTDTGDFGGSISARLAQVNPVQAAPIVGAPEESAIAVTIEISNGSAAPIGLDSVAVTLTDSAGNPAPSINDTSAAPFAGMMVEGGRAQATYVFVVPNDARNPVTITIAYSASAPTLAFSGEIAGS